jgi:hypothetical protein
MKWDASFKGTLEKFPGAGGWVYVAVPKKSTNHLPQQSRAWGTFPITVHVGKTFWHTKLMMKKGGDYFVALKAAVRKKEKLSIGDKVSVSIRLG